jgi:hypothetical protein
MDIFSQFSVARELLQRGELEQALAEVDETIGEICRGFISSSFQSGCWGCVESDVRY